MRENQQQIKRKPSKADLDSISSEFCLPGVKYDKCIIEAYGHKNKGIKQILWQRGIKIPRDATADDKIDEITGAILIEGLRTILGKCKDFKCEKPVIARILHDRGHICEFSPKCHPELAGVVGVEWSWGKSKLEYRRHINDGTQKNFKRNVEAALSEKILQRGRVWSLLVDVATSCTATIYLLSRLLPTKN
jgi:hypothetical protein